MLQRSSVLSGHTWEGLLASSGHHRRSLPRRRDTELLLQDRHFSGGAVPPTAPEVLLVSLHLILRSNKKWVASRLRKWGK